jgi:ABC-type sulfate transport system substrate-binding protein
MKDKKYGTDEVAEYTTYIIWKNRESLLPADYNISIDELKSKVYFEMGCLIKQFIENPKAMELYIFNDLKKNVISKIFDDYKTAHLEKLEYINTSILDEISNKEEINLKG